MNYLYQIVTSTFAYTLYEEEGEVFLHVLNLSTEESNDVFGITKLMNTLNEDPEVSFEDIIDVDDVIASVLLRIMTSSSQCSD